jgi:uncharacterized hydrophobic protein (TIGR00271 family)
MSKVSSEAIEKLNRDLASDAQLDLNFLVLTLSSCLIASLGLLMNSAAVIIGAMIIAPLMLPLRGLALATLKADRELFNQSLTTLGSGTLVSVAIAWLIGRVFSLPASEFGTEILARTQPNLADLFVAVAAGAVSGFAKIRPQLSDALAGTAVAVALMPPLCVVGITLSQGDWLAGGGALVLYGTNLLGITLACLLVFVWGGYYFDSMQMRRALRWGLSMTLLFVIPLFISLAVLLKQKTLQSTIKDLLKNQTITVGQQVELVKMQVNWSSLPWSNKPATIILTVSSGEPVTSKQVAEVENFLYRKLGQRFKVIFRVDQFQQVTSDQFESNLPHRQLYPSPIPSPNSTFSPQSSPSSTPNNPSNNSQPTPTPSSQSRQ